MLLKMPSDLHRTRIGID